MLKFLLGVVLCLCLSMNLFGTEKKEINRETEIKQLINLLREKDWRIAASAESELIKVGKEAVPFLVKILDEPDFLDFVIVPRVIKILGKIKDKSVVPVLLEIAKGKKKVSIYPMRAESIEALVEIGDTSVIPDFIEIYKDLRDKPDTIKTELKTKEGKPIYDYTPMYTRNAVIKALGIFKVESMIPFFREDLISLTEKARKDDFPWLKIGKIHVLIEALGRLGDRQTIPIIKKLLENKFYMGKLNSTIIREALRNIGGKEAISALKIYLKHPDYRIRAFTIASIGDIGGEEEIEFLKEFIKKEKNPIVIQVAEKNIIRIKERLQSKQEN